MQNLGRRYVGQFNARHQRTGTLWEGRYKSCLVDGETYVLRCYRYIDLNPVRARMTEEPIQFAWSSAAAHAGRRIDSLLTPHSAYLALGKNTQERGNAYETLICESLADDELLAIRLHLQQQRALGRDAFRAMVEAKTQRFAGVRPPIGHARESKPDPFIACRSADVRATINGGMIDAPSLPHRGAA